MVACSIQMRGVNMASDLKQRMGAKMTSLQTHMSKLSMKDLMADHFGGSL